MFQRYFPSKSKQSFLYLSISFLAIAGCLSLFTQPCFANDKIKQALKNYEARMEAERAKVIAVFERESRIAERQRDFRQQQWLGSAKRAWMNNELVITERGGLRFFNGAEESFAAKDFGLSGDFKLEDQKLVGSNGSATIRLAKPAVATYFRGIVESKNNFAIQLNHSKVVTEKDIAIIVGGWNNKRSEIHLDGQVIASKPVGMPRRWLCEVYCQNQSVSIFANGSELMSGKLTRPVTMNLATIAGSYDSKTTIHSPVFKAK